MFHNIHVSFCNQLPIDIFAVIDNTAVVRVSLTFCPFAQVLLSVRPKDGYPGHMRLIFGRCVAPLSSPCPPPDLHPGWTNPPSLSRRRRRGAGKQHEAPHCLSGPQQRAEKVWNRQKPKTRKSCQHSYSLVVLCELISSEAFPNGISEVTG